MSEGWERGTLGRDREEGVRLEKRECISDSMHENLLNSPLISEIHIAMESSHTFESNHY